MTVPLRDRLLRMLEADTLGEGIVWNDLGTVNRKVYAERLGVTRKAISYHQSVIAHFDKFGPKVEPNERRLRRLLEADADAGTIVVSHVNKIHRDHYAEALGGLQNTQYYRSIFEEFEAKLGLVHSTEHRLRQMLEADFAMGSLPISRGGKINRSHYAKLLGISQSALTRHVAMFEQFECRRGGTKRFLPADLEEMHAWLENYLSESGTRPARSKVNRALFKSAFGITHGNVERYYPEVGVLLAEYDGKIAGLIKCRGAAQRTNKMDVRAETVTRLNFEEGTAVVTGAADIVRRFPSLAVHQTYKPGSTKARLILALNDCLRKNRMPRSKRDGTQISRSHFADKLGVTLAMMAHLKSILKDYEAILEIIEPVATLPVAPKFGAYPDSSKPLDEVARQVVSLYPHLSSHQHYPSESTAKRIVQILNGQIVQGGLERSRGGKINRKGITMQLGLSETAITQYLSIIDDYEEAVGGKESATEAKIPAMREWFEEQMRAGTLQIRDGKISRVQFYEQFRLPKSNAYFTRYPRLAALVDEFDERITADGYQPCDVAAKLDELKAILEDDPPIDKDGQTISKKAIEKALGLPWLSLARPPYAAFIARAQEELSKALREDRLIAFAGGRIFKFDCLVRQGWPRSFAIRAKECFERVYRNQKKDVAKTYFAGLTEVLSFIAGEESQSCRSVREGIANGIGVKMLTKDFTLATQEYRDHLRVRYENVDSRNGKIGATNAVIRHLGADSVLPPLELPLIGFRNDNKTHLRSIAEVTQGAALKRSKPHVDDYLEFAVSMVKQAAEVRQIKLEAKEQSDFNKVLRKELEAEDFTAADSPASVILRVLDRRLGLIKKAAEAQVQIGRADLERGRELLERGEDPGHNFDKILNVPDVGQTERRKLLRQYFPADDGREQGIANLLKVVAERYDFIYPGNKLEGRPEGQFFQKRALEYGGANKLQAYLLPSPEVVSSVLTLYLLESGSNVSVGRTLYFECIETTDEPHHSKITGYKARARGKPIFVILDDKSDAIRAMRWLQEAVGRIPNVDSETKKQLFVARNQGEKITLVEEFSYRGHFKRLIASIPELADLPLTPNMLRLSILLKAALESDGRTRLSMAIGQHGRNVHEGYVNKYPIRFLRDTEIRHFERSLETVVISGIEEAHKFLGVDADSMARRVEGVMKTGLGTLCRNRNGRPGNEGFACKSIDCWNDCPQLIVIAKKDEIAILQVWQHSLRLVEGDWVRDQPERWETVWLPWLCFVDAVEVKMRQSFASVWRDATKISEQIISARHFQPMRLF